MSCGTVSDDETMSDVSDSEQEPIRVQPVPVPPVVMAVAVPDSEQEPVRVQPVPVPLEVMAAAVPAEAETTKKCSECNGCVLPTANEETGYRGDPCDAWCCGSCGGSKCKDCGNNLALGEGGCVWPTDDKAAGYRGDPCETCYCGAHGCRKERDPRYPGDLNCCDVYTSGEDDASESGGATGMVACVAQEGPTNKERALVEERIRDVLKGGGLSVHKNLCVLETLYKEKKAAWEKLKAAREKKKAAREKLKAATKKKTAATKNKKAATKPKKAAK